MLKKHSIAIGCCCLFAWLIGLAYGTCVLDSDFGFILNCNFKKSSLFRVRNLGGAKFNFGLGFSLGDELGFAESLGNVEGSKRRSLSQRDNVLNNNNIGVLPASRMPPSPPIQQNRPKAVVAWQPPPPAPLPFPSRLMPIEQRPRVPTMTEAVSLPLGVPAFRPIPSISTTSAPPQDSFNRKISLQYQVSNLTYLKPMVQSQMPVKETVIQKIPPNLPIVKEVPVFQAMPSSISRISTNLETTNDILKRNSVYQTNKNEELNNKSPIPESIGLTQMKLPKIDLMGHTVEELATIANVSVEAIQRAIQLKQQQLLIEQQAKIYEQHMEMIRTSTTSTTTTTTLPPPTRPSTTTVMTSMQPTKRYQIAGGNKVMNAPKEYYPVGYEKNFDDNFISKVDLPTTSFYCGDQKHFPGLYADMDLGCMVFHVCALTDDGLIMKSFLCPESTLFDQTVLKCNWWFYVDCKSSKNLYDSNLPVSKSYQLMKALTFFSNYKNGQNEKSGVDVEALKNSVASTKTT